MGQSSGIHRDGTLSAPTSPDTAEEGRLKDSLQKAPSGNSLTSLSSAQSSSLQHKSKTADDST